MFAIGAIMALSWSSVAQFLIPLRGTREFGLDRGGVSGLLALGQLVDLAALLPLGVIREHIEPRALAWRTGLYRVGVDATAFLGPLICGLLGEAQTPAFIGLVGLAAVAVGA